MVFKIVEVSHWHDSAVTALFSERGSVELSRFLLRLSWNVATKHILQIVEHLVFMQASFLRTDRVNYIVGRTFIRIKNLLFRSNRLLITYLFLRRLYSSMSSLHRL